MDNSPAVIIFNSNPSPAGIEKLIKEAKEISSDILCLSSVPLNTDVPHIVFEHIEDALNRCNDFMKGRKNDLLILSGTSFNRNVYDGLGKILNLAERHCAVAPRGNRAGLLSVPVMEYLQGNPAEPEKSKRCFEAVTGKLPRYHIAPYPSASCVLLKGYLINKFGLFDTDCSCLEDAVICWCLRMGQYGYSTISANRFFLPNENVPDDKHPTFTRKYPYAEALKENYIKYFISPYDRMASVADATYYEKPKVLLSMLLLAPVYNGTSEHTFSVADRLVANYGDKYDFYLLITRENAEFFNVKKNYKNIVYSDNVYGAYHLGLTFGQIYFADVLATLNRHCLKIISTVLDLISYRCDQLAVQTDSLIFCKSIGYSDGIITISEFTKNDLMAAFPTENKYVYPEIKSVLISVNDKKYMRTSQSDIKPPFKKYILVFGNPFKHKLLEKVYPFLKNIKHNFIIVGYTASEKTANIRTYNSGGLPYEFIETLYDKCDALLFPSEYEGFGLPLVNSLKKGKKVIVSRTEINAELQKAYPEYTENFIYFDSFEEIKDIIENTRFVTCIKKNVSSYSYDNVAEKTERFIDKIVKDPLNDARFLIRNEIMTTAEYTNRASLTFVKSYLRTRYPSLFKAAKKLQKFAKRFK